MVSNNSIVCALLSQLLQDPTVTAQQIWVSNSQPFK